MDTADGSTAASEQIGDIVVGLLIRVLGLGTGLALLITSALVLL
jgi:hypothetical protein